MLFIKKMCGGENKKYRSVGLSVGFLVVNGQYNLSACLLSKWFVPKSINFSCLLSQYCRLRLAYNDPGAAAVADLEPLNCLRNENSF